MGRWMDVWMGCWVFVGVLGDRLDALGDHTLADMIDWAGWIDGWMGMGGKEGRKVLGVNGSLHSTLPYLTLPVLVSEVVRYVSAVW